MLSKLNNTDPASSHSIHILIVKLYIKTPASFIEKQYPMQIHLYANNMISQVGTKRTEKWCCPPKSEGHSIKTSLHLTEEHSGGLHLQPILLTGVPFVDGCPQASISCLCDRSYRLNVHLSPLYETLKSMGLQSSRTDLQWQVSIIKCGYHLPSLLLC